MTMFASFFKDKHGKVVLGQWPNWPIWLIIAISILTSRIDYLNQELSVLVSGLLIYWGYLEITQGVNTFRKVLGIVGIGYAIVRLLQ